MVNRISISRLAIRQLKFQLIIDLENKDRLEPVNLFLLKSGSVGTKSSAKLYEIVSLVTKMGRSGGQLSVASLVPSKSIKKFRLISYQIGFITFCFFKLNIFIQ